MNTKIAYLFKIFKGLKLKISFFYYHTFCIILFYLNKVEHKSFRCIGKPRVNISIHGVCKIGANFFMQNNSLYSIIGNRPCKLIVNKGAILIIGDNVGISSVSINAYTKIVIGNNVKIGACSVVFDTDFHSIDASIRSTKEDMKFAKKLPVYIQDNVFIGANCIITKGVTIGYNSIIAAGSVVVKSIPADEVWGGNPAKFIKRIV